MKKQQLCDEMSLEISNNMNILFTPKYHCKIAGEGIEYLWGASKRWYRRYPLKNKKNNAKISGN